MGSGNSNSLRLRDIFADVALNKFLKMNQNSFRFLGLTQILYFPILICTLFEIHSKSLILENCLELSYFSK